MGLEELQQLVANFALGAVSSRQAVRDAFASSNIAVPAGKLVADAEVGAVTYTLFVWVDDYAAQATFVIFEDSGLSDQVIDSLQMMNGWAAASPADATSATEQFAMVRVMSLIDSVSVDEWVQPEDKSDPMCPNQTELDSLSKLPIKGSFVVNGDGSIWKHGPKPPQDLLDLSYSRVVSFNRVM